MIKKVLFVVALTIQFAAATEAPSVSVVDMPDCYPCRASAVVKVVDMPDCYPCLVSPVVSIVDMPDCYPCLQ